MATHGVRLRCLGRFEVTVDGEPVGLRSRRAGALLGYLAATGTTCNRRALACMVWPDRPEERALANLRVVLTDLRRTVGSLLDITRDTVGMAPQARDRVDVLRFRAAADRALARARVTDARPLLRAAIDEYAGELLAGVTMDDSPEYELWLTTARTELHLRAISVLEALVDTEVDHGPTRRTVEAARRLVALSPTRERSQVRLMLAQWHIGDRAEALAGYEAWAHRFVDDLSLPVPDEVRSVAARIRAGEPPPGRAHRQRTRLPQPVTPLVGRDHDLRRSADLLASGERLITLTGPAGVGKTVLGIALCHRHRDETSLPVTYVDLVDVTSGDLAQAIADATSEALHGMIEAPTMVGDRDLVRGLLVLDNFEHLLDERGLLVDLLAASPDLQVLVTSRTPLGLPVERVVALAPLDVPSSGDDDHAVGGAAATRLFLERAAAAGAAITATRENLRLVTRACRAVDGLPLAIEIAAARTRMLGLSGLTSALTGDQTGAGPLDVLARRHNGAGRHRSVRSALAWSVNLLVDTARDLLWRLSVFSGSFDLDAAVGVCAADAGDEARVVDALAELVDFHLINRVSAPGPRARFRLAVTTREFAAEELAAAGLADEVARRHAEYHAAAARAAVGRAGAAVWRDRVANLANVAAACRWFIAHDRIDDAQALLADVGPAWRYAGLTGLGLRTHTAVLNAGVGTDPTTAAACAIWRAALVAEERGREAAAAVEGLIEDHLPAVRADRDPDRWARCMAEAVRTLSYVGEHSPALDLAAELAEGAVTAGQRRAELGARWQTGWIAHKRGDDERVEQILRGLLSDAIALGNRRVELYAWMLAEMSAVDPSTLADRPPNLQDLLALADEVDDHQLTMWLHCSLGAAAVLAHRLGEAPEHFRKAMTLAVQDDYLPAQGYCVLGMVTMRVEAGDLATACRLHAAAEPHLEDLSDVLPSDYRAMYEAVVDGLGAAAADDPDLTAAWEHGAELPLHEAAVETRRLLHQAG